MTKPIIISTDPNNPSQEALSQAKQYAMQGDAIVFPTDTVYGIGVVATKESTPDLLFNIKKRDRSQTIPWLVSGKDALLKYGEDVAPYCIDLAQKYWPGPLTLIVKANENVPDAFKGEDKTIALRMPNCKFVCELIDALGAPLATTSANMHGKPASNSFEGLDPQLLNLVPIAVDGGIAEQGEPSTIISCVTDTPEVIRKGGICIN